MTAYLATGSKASKIVKVVYLLRATETFVSLNQDTTPLLNRKLESEGQRMRTLSDTARPKHVQTATPTLPTVRITAENKAIRQAVTNLETQRKESYRFLSIQAAPKNHPEQNSAVTVLLSKSLEFSAELTGIAMTAETAYKLCIAHEFLSPPCISPFAPSILELALVSSARR